MGNQLGTCCHKAKIEVIKKNIGRDIEFQSFQEVNGQIFDIIEKFNVYAQYDFEEITLLYFQNFKDSENVGEINFNLFIEKKFLKNVVIADWVLNDTLAYSKLKDYNTKFFSIFYKAFKSYYKSLKDTKWKQHDEVPLICLIAQAILYGKGRFDAKIEYMFNYLANKSGNFELNDDVRFFLFGLFAIPSAVELFTFKTIAEENEQYKKEIEKFDFETIFQGYEVKDAINSTSQMITSLFGDKNELTYEEFYSKMTTNRNIQSLLTPDGIRHFISNNGV